MGFQRARNQEQKDIRIKQIAAAAAKLYEDLEYDKITLAAIADELSFTRANLYKYIKSKEEIFLHIILNDFKGWTTALAKAFKNKKDVSNEEFADTWTNTMYEHKRLIKLMSLLYTIIEKNVSVQKLAEFKVELLKGLDSLLNFIGKLLPKIPKEKLEDFLMMQVYYVIGMYPSTIHGENQKKAIALAGIDHPPPDFVNAYKSFILYLIKGMMDK